MAINFSMATNPVFLITSTLQMGFVLAILGGHDVTIDQVPYQVNYGDICGGVLIHAKWSMTSAHCGTHDFIRIGSRYRLRGPKVKVISHSVHPRYGMKHTYDYDIQLLELKRKLLFGKMVAAILLCDGVCGDEFLVAGWGYPIEKGEFKEILQQAQISLVPFDQCQKIDQFWYNHTLTSRMFCAGDELRDACQGDSGGGAVSGGQLVGLSSFGVGCGRVPGVYVNVAHPAIRKWITQLTGV